MTRTTLLALALALLPALALAGPREREPQLDPAERQALAEEQGKTSPLVTVRSRANDGCALRVSIDQTGADARTLLRDLARVSAVQLVLADDIEGTVSVYLHDVPVEEAFYTVLDMVGGWAHGGDNWVLVVNTIPKQGPAVVSCGNCYLAWLRPWPHAMY